MFLHHVFSGGQAGAVLQEERPMDFAPSGNGRMVVALLVLGTLAILVWRTMEPGRYQQLTWILLVFFAFRVLLTRWRSR